jgi:hypothetical protein
MFPVLVLVYRRLARFEETEVAARFADAWDAYAAITPAFLPRRRPVQPPSGRDHVAASEAPRRAG